MNILQSAKLAGTGTDMWIHLILTVLYYMVQSKAKRKIINSTKASK
jgi:hypothetical protein